MEFVTPDQWKWKWKPTNHSFNSYKTMEDGFGIWCNKIWKSFKICTAINTVNRVVHLYPYKHTVDVFRTQNNNLITLCTYERSKVKTTKPEKWKFYDDLFVWVWIRSMLFLVSLLLFVVCCWLCGYEYDLLIHRSSYSNVRCLFFFNSLLKKQSKTNS